MQQANPPRLGAFKLVGDSVGMFFRHFFVFLLISVVPALIAVASGYILTVQGFEFDETGFGSSAVIALVIVGAIGVICAFIATGAGTLAAYDLSLGRKVRYGFYVRRSLVALPIVVLLGLVFYILFAVGLALLIVPGLWVAARVIAT
ncbi:MAG: hypothetical protein AAFV62_11195 [Pseudomonadota bacterium]